MRDAVGLVDLVGAVAVVATSEIGGRATLRRFAAAILLAFGVSAPAPASSATWGADYFPNVPLITQDGEAVRFFDDLIKDKIVAINFIYTTCPDSCPLETAQLVRVQRILGDRLGQDIFFYSISIDPEVDTPAVLREYRERFGARWTFLTGDEADIVQLRRKLGLYVEEIQDGTNNHNLNMIIGNQATGRWMKRSPTENPYVLADQLGNWLDGWRRPPQGADYANAPRLRSISSGEQLFRTRCQVCHTVTGNEVPGALGPDLLGVTSRREKSWLLEWLRAPDQMLEQKDPIAMKLYAEYGNVAMPNMRLNRQEAGDLLDFLDAKGVAAEGERPQGPSESVDARESAPAASDGEVVAIMNAWVRETDANALVNAGYMTLINVGPSDVTLVKVESQSFDAVEVHEMAMADGLMKMRELTDLVIPANARARFAPGGKHLMLKKPKQHLQVGDTVDLTLTFKSGRQQTVSVDVASR
jgi:copper(I)-binding protein/cytochrome oxidase Cu insertion factor (SCO1/SenC/PrrC family)